MKATKSLTQIYLGSTVVAMFDVGIGATEQS
jgi:hypothetical protein